MPRFQDICKVDGCNNLQTLKNSNPYKNYRTVCQKHHRESWGGPTPYERKSAKRKNFCENCGWDEGTCDLHRFKKDDGCGNAQYVEGNIITLCPNCHRLVHDGKLEVAKCP